jgi:membrane protease YdiL (CAAX protease family)
MPSRRFLIWFLAALLPMVGSQLLRLQQSEPALWLLCDYAGRLGMIAVLMAIPGARVMAFRRETASFDAGQIAIWIIVLWMIQFFLIATTQAALSYLVPVPRLGFYPATQGLLHWFDITAGLVLAAYSEELLFRRVARTAFGSILGDGWLMIAVTSILFGGYHWWTGLWNMLGAAATGALFMVFYRRAGVLWPVVTVHYVIDFMIFR